MRILVIDIAASSGGALSVLKQFYQFVAQIDHENSVFYKFYLKQKYILKYV